MKITCDPARNVAYLRPQEKKNGVETIRVCDAMNIDLAPDGTVYGIELLEANAQLASGDKGRLVFVNETSAKTFEIPLAG